MLPRYGNLEQFANYEIETFLRLIMKAQEERQRAEIHAQYCSLLPQMAIGLLKYMPFQEYFDQCTGRNIDRRSAEEILAESRAIAKELEKGQT